jgi:rhomboid protease GluP
VLAPLFLHANVLHVGSNLIALVVAGGVAERVYGHARFLVLFALAGACGSLASLAHQAALPAHAVGSIGASGAAYGVGAAVIAAAVRLRGVIPPWRARALVGATMPLLLSSLVAGFARPEVDSAAHLGGAVAGLLLGLAFPFAPQLTLRTEGGAARVAWGVSSLFAAILLLGSVAIAFGLPRPL